MDQAHPSSPHHPPLPVLLLDDPPICAVEPLPLWVSLPQHLEGIGRVEGGVLLRQPEVGIREDKGDTRDKRWMLPPGHFD